MRAVKGKNTSPELLLRKALRAHGVTGYRLHRKDIAGKPDLAFIGKKVAVFVDGAWWHGHPDKWWLGRSGDYWDAKIQGNINRDRAVDATLAEQGWTVIRLWDFEITKNPEEAAKRVIEAVR
jgi:DNA mismatch endonuclease (patch repair protein)